MNKIMEVYLNNFLISHINLHAFYLGLYGQMNLPDLYLIRISHMNLHALHVG